MAAAEAAVIVDAPAASASVDVPTLRSCVVIDNEEMEIQDCVKRESRAVEEGQYCESVA